MHSSFKRISECQESQSAKRPNRDATCFLVWSLWKLLHKIYFSRPLVSSWCASSGRWGKSLVLWVPLLCDLITTVRYGCDMTNSEDWVEETMSEIWHAIWSKLNTHEQYAMATSLKMSVVSVSLHRRSIWHKAELQYLHCLISLKIIFTHYRNRL